MSDRGGGPGAPGAGTPEPPRWRVLVLDDEQDMVEMMQRMLRGAFDVVATTRAAEAMGWLESESFDAVVVDQRLRDGTGTSVLARAAALSPLCRRIAISGHAEMGDLLAAINVGKVSRFVLKPLSRDALVGALRESLAEYAAERDELERYLVARGQQRGVRHHVGERRGGRRARGRGRPSYWPASSTVRVIRPEDPAALVALLGGDLDLVVAALDPERALTRDQHQAWCAEVELRLVTRLRDTDQAFRVAEGGFVVVFARTSMDGCRRACRRLAAQLAGGLDIDLVAWPGGVAGADALLDRLFT